MPDTKNSAGVPRFFAERGEITIPPSDYTAAPINKPTAQSMLDENVFDLIRRVASLEKRAADLEQRLARRGIR